MVVSKYWKKLSISTYQIIVQVNLNRKQNIIIQYGRQL